LRDDVRKMRVLVRQMEPTWLLSIQRNRR